MKRSRFFLLVLTCFFFNVAQAQLPNCNALWSSSASGSVVTFQDQSTANSTITNWLWNFGDGSYSNQQNPVHAYANQTNYGVTLTITTAQGASCSYYDTVTVSGTCTTSCQAAFGYTESGGVVSFSDTSNASGNIVGWYWDFGDGSFSYSQNPNHAYAVNGWYNVCLTIYTDDSCSSTWCDSVYTQCNTQCGPASFTYTVNGNTVSFNNTSQGTYASSGWIFGGGVPFSSQTNPTITYPGPGTYTPCLCIYDANGNLCDIVCDTIVIAAPPCNVSTSATYTVSGNTVFFNGTVTGPSTTWFVWYFGDGSPGVSNNLNPVHTYPGPGTYYASLYAQDSLNGSCWDSVSITVIIPPSNNLNCSANFTAIDSGNNVIFIDQSTSNGNIVSYFWNFGDGSTSTQQNPTHFYTQNGTYGPCLTITAILNGDTCTDTHCDTVVVGSGSNCGPASFTYTVSGNTVYFTNTSQGTYATSGWTFGGGSGNGSATNPTVTYPGPGTYSVCLCIYDAAGNLCDIICDTIVIPGSNLTCNADFYAIDSGNTVFFQNTSTSSGTIVSYYWNFGDGATSTQQNPIHYYNQPGTYGPCLTITAISGQDTCSSTHCDTVTIGSGGCNANVSYTYTISGNTVTFNNNSTVPANGGYYWWFSDNTNSYQFSPVKTFPGPGTYTACFMVYDSTNWACYDSACVSITIPNNNPLNCNAIFYSLDSGNTVFFQNASTSNGNIVSYYWSFGDGNTSTQQNPIHYYSQPGTYGPCLTITSILNGDTCTDTQCDTVVIGNGGGCNGTLSIGYTVSGNTVSFSNNSNIPSTSLYSWWFSDGNYSYQFAPTHTFPGPGTWYACFSYVDSLNNNCYDSTCVTVVIPNSNPLNCNADFIAIDSGNTVIFLDQSTTNGSSVSYYWDFGDGGTSTQQNPSHFYSQPGTYVACLFLTSYLNGDSCISVYCDSVQVTNGGNCNANAAFTFSSFGTTVSFTNNSTLPNNGYFYWYFSDGTFSYDWNPIHTFPSTGNWTACVAVFDSVNWNCWDSTCQSVNIQNRQPSILTQVPIWELGFKSVNPVQEVGEFSFDLEQAGDLTISVWDLSGKELKVITSGERSEGHHEVEWQAVDLPAGMYFYRIQISDYIQTEKFIKL